MNFGPDPQPTPKPPQPTLEQCLALMKTAEKYNQTWNVVCYPSLIYICGVGSPVTPFSSLADLHQWLLKRQPSKTVTVEIDRKDAETVAAFSSNDLLVSRFTQACKKALEN